ncbi:MAG: benzoate/H(+) symporter BenE family transporter [Dongiaceae bacterium]
MNGGLSVQAVVAGLLAALVGFSSAVVVLPGLAGVGATPAQAASGLIALSIAMGVGGIWLSFRTRMPISVAWSTPGAALLVTAGAVEGGFAAAVGAFLVVGVLIVIAGFWKPLGRWVTAIPSPLANAMLAGVLLGFCLAPVQAVAEVPLQALPIIVVWALVVRFRRLYAVPAAVVVTVLMIAFTTDISMASFGSLWPQPILILPDFTLQALIGIALPLFIVTMASQNVTGIAVLSANGYRPDAGPLFRDTGILSLLAAPFGGHAINLAAITAALCAGPEAHPDPARRWWAAATAGLVYILFGLMAGAATAFLTASPPILIKAVAGLALLGAFASALMGAVADAKDREAAIVTFVVTASGLTFFGISGAFWGLIAGGAVYALMRWTGLRRKPDAPSS